MENQRDQKLVDQLEQNGKDGSLMPKYTIGIDFGTLSGRAVLVEVEYARAMKQAELEWVRSLIEDLRSGRLAWDREALGRLAATQFPCGEGDKTEG